MASINSSFLEEYKRLDKLCREMYKSDIGITNYINDMKYAALFESRRIPNWNSDLSNLIRLRHIRNQLTHEIGTLDISMCTQNDVDWLVDFRGRILQASDPIAMLHKHKVREAQPVSVAYEMHTVESAPTDAEKKAPIGCLIAFGVVMIILIAWIVAVLMLWH